MEDIPQKKIRENDTNELDAEENKKISGKCSIQHLTYDVLRIIFKYLNGMELSSASMVCRSWLEAANNEKRTRGPVCTRKYIVTSANENPHPEYLKSQIIKQLRIKPTLGLLFTAPYVVFPKEECHCKVLPTNCNTITLDTYGIVVDNEIEENQDCLGCAFFPEIPNVSIKTFKISGNRSQDALTKSTAKFIEKIKETLDASEKTDHTSKCLLLFCDLQNRNLAIKISNALKRRYTAKEVSVWGGVAKNILVCKARDKKKNVCGKLAFCVGITLTGSITSWSVIVDANCKTKERVEQRLKLFKSRVALKKHSIGFMFACCARGEEMFDESNLESSIFKKLFPEVPLVGCIGDGEFGTNTLSSESSNERGRWYNQVTTVFLIITYT